MLAIGRVALTEFLSSDAFPFTGKICRLVLEEKIEKFIDRPCKKIAKFVERLPEKCQNSSIRFGNKL